MPVNLGHLEAFLGLNTVGLTAGLATAQKSLTSAGRSMRRTGGTMTRSLSLPLALIGGAAVKMSVDFEKAFSKIEGLVGISADKVDAFKGQVLALAGPTAQAPQKLAEAMFFITSAGLRGADALDVLKMSAQAAAANVGDVAVIADLVTSATNAYGIEMLSAAQATDTLVAAVREGKRPPEEIAGSIGRVLPIASELGVTFQEVGASIAAMSRTGTDAAEAVTGLRQILFSILKPSQGAEEAFLKMGTSSQKLKELLGSEGGLVKLLSFLRKNTTKTTNAFKDAFPNVRALAGALDLMGKNMKENKRIFATMVDNTGDLKKALEAAAKTASFKFNQAMAEIKVEMIKLGEILMPIFLDIIKVVRKAVDWFSDLSTGAKQLGAGIAIMLIGIGPAITIIGGLVTALGFLAGVFAALTWPITAVIAAVVILGGALLSLWDNWKAIIERISDWSWWENMLIDMTLAFTELFRNLIRIVNKGLIIIGKTPLPNPFENWAKDLEASKDPMKKFEHQFVSMSDSVSMAGAKIKKALKGMFNFGGGGGGTPAPATSGGEGGAATGSQMPVIDWEKMRSGTDKWSASASTLTSTLSVLKDQIVVLKREATELGTAIQNALNTAFIELGETLGTLFSGDAGASTFFEGLLSIVASFMKTFGQALIAAGIASEAFKNLLSVGGGFLAIAAGVALIAAASVVKNTLKKGPQGLRSGGFVKEGGMFQLHKDELVNLPNGSAVTPAGIAKGKQDIIIHGEISGRVIKLIYDEENRITGNSN